MDSKVESGTRGIKKTWWEKGEYCEVVGNTLENEKRVEGKWWN